MYRPMSDHSLLAETDRKLYLGILEEIYRRIEQARIFIQRGATQPAIESSALQLRIVIELIVMASLVTNKAKVEEITTALAKKRVDEARKLVRSANPDYWPKADRAHDEPGKIRQLLPVEGALTEDRWLREWGMLSELLHARNRLRHLSTLSRHMQTWCGLQPKSSPSSPTMFLSWPTGAAYWLARSVPEGKSASRNSSLWDRRCSAPGIERNAGR